MICDVDMRLTFTLRLYEAHGLACASSGTSLPRMTPACLAHTGDDVRRAVAHLRKRRGVRALVLQGAGGVFCAGGNPYGSRRARSWVASARAILDSTVGFVEMGTLHAPIACALHGAMVGGAAAVFLHTDLRVVDEHATFQHGTP